jgi:hypothetical protein
MASNETKVRKYSRLRRVQGFADVKLPFLALHLHFNTGLRIYDATVSRSHVPDSNLSAALLEDVSSILIIESPSLGTKHRIACWIRGLPEIGRSLWIDDVEGVSVCSVR